VVAHPFLPLRLHLLFRSLPRVRIGFLPFGYDRSWYVTRNFFMSPSDSRVVYAIETL
jgi:hypothetical protein